MNETKKIVYSNLSVKGSGVCIVDVQGAVANRSWCEAEARRSSAWRYLFGIYTILI